MILIMRIYINKKIILLLSCNLFFFNLIKLKTILLHNIYKYKFGKNKIKFSDIMSNIKINELIII